MAMGTMTQADRDARKGGGSEMPQEGMRHALGNALESARVANVFGDPITQDGVTVIPVARVQGKGGGGGGAGQAQDGQAQRGRGGGFGVSTKPVGVFVLKNGNVSWRPSVDVNKVVIGGQIVAGIAVLALRSILRSRHR
jgi:uncharacterized spore protein YtfJ